VKYRFTGFELGVEYDPGGWYMSGELFNTRDSGIGRTRSWSLGGGYRVGKFTPYFVASKIKQTTVGDFGLAPVFDQKTSAAGVRWDFMKNIDAKLQYQRIDIGSDSIPTSFVNLQPGLRVGDQANVISGTIDFVW
jgi:predicted porin